MSSLSRVVDWSTRAAWGAMFLTLPFTSFPFFPSGLGGTTLVRPLAVYPLIILLLIATLPRLFSGRLPKTSLPLFAFVLVATASSLIALASGSDSRQGVSIAERLVRNLVTLGIGCAFYLTVALVPRHWDDLKSTLRWLYAGFGIALLWGSMQALYVVHFSQSYFDWISRLQAYVSTRKLFPTRISGLTYEPKWFAEQITLLLVPWLLASVLQRRTVFKWRYRWITVELFLLVWSAAVVAFTFSRTGYAILGLALVLGWLMNRLGRTKPAAPDTEKVAHRQPYKRWLITLGTVTVVILFGALVSQNRYFSRFWRYWTDDATNKTYLEYIAVGQRLVYLETAYRMYQDYPALGVGLGNYAFHFDEMLPDRAWFRQPEIIRHITPIEGNTRLITPKNLYARLLSETGLVGFITFAGFLLAVFGCAVYLWLSPLPEESFWGLAGMIGAVVVVIVATSVDSFAIPNLWVVCGLITAAAHFPQPEVPQSEPETQSGAPIASQAADGAL